MRIKLLLTCVATLLVSGRTSAAPIIVEFSGVIQTISDAGGALPPGVVVEAPFNGSYTIDPDLYAGGFELQSGLVRHDVPVNLQVDVAGNPFDRVTSTVFIADAQASGDFWSIPVFPSGPTGGLNATVSFLDSTRTRIFDPFDFFVNTSLAGWDDANLTILQETGSGRTILAQGDILSLTIIPEPATALLVGLGLLGLAMRRE